MGFTGFSRVTLSLLNLVLFVVPLVGLMLMNPVDVARGLVITQLDVPALMGLTGTLFERAFGSALGSMVAVTALCAWVAVPFTVAGRRFQRRDF